MRTARESRALADLADAAAEVASLLPGDDPTEIDNEFMTHPGDQVQLSIALADLHRSNDAWQEAQLAASERKPRHLKASRKTAAERKSWDEIKRAVCERAGNRCELRFAGLRCGDEANDGHHIFGKSDESVRTVLAVCRGHHDELQNPKDPVIAWRTVANTLRVLGYSPEETRALRKAQHFMRKARLSAMAEQRRGRG